MALPVGWPPRPASGTRSIRFYKECALTDSFVDNAYIFAQQTTANPYRPLPFVTPGSTASVVIGDFDVSGSPLGTGRDSGNPDPIFASPVLPAPEPMIWCRAFILHALDADVEFSFDGQNVHGFVPSGEEVMYFDRYEAGIALRVPSGTGNCIFEAW